MGLISVFFLIDCDLQQIPKGVEFNFLIFCAGPDFLTLDAPLGTIPVHIRGGSILPMQSYHLTTDKVKSSPLKLIVALNDPEASRQTAAGQFYMDSGDSILVNGEDSMLVSLESIAKRESGEVSIVESIIKSDKRILIEEVLVLGLDCKGGISVVSSRGSQVSRSQVEHSKEKGLIRVTGLESTLSNGSILSWRCNSVAIS